MKKLLLTITLSTLGALVLVMPTLAATTILLSPASVSVKSGQSFNVSITVNPQGASNYVEKVELKYPADILQVNSFTFNSAWTALTQSGYDLTDNINGVLIKSAGYPGGLSSATTFGTISFYAKKAGSGAITIGSNSLAFEISSQSALIGAPVSFTITTPIVTAPKPSATQKPTVTTTPVPAQKQAEVNQATSTLEQKVASPVAAEDKSLFSATIINVQITLGEILIFLAILLAGFIVFKVLKRNRF